MDDSTSQFFLNYISNFSEEDKLNGNIYGTCFMEGSINPLAQFKCIDK